MTWAKFDDRYPWHRKVRGLSDAAFRMDVSAVCWCAENLTDGVIESEFLTLVSDVRNPRKVAAELVRAGRWHAEDHDCESCPLLPPGAHVIHDYLDYNPTREKIERDREQRRKAGERGGVASGRARSKSEASCFDSAKQNGSKTEATAASSPTNPRTRARTRSLTPTTSVEGGSHVSSARDEPPLYPDQCRRHGNTYEPGPCGDCADARKDRLRLASVGPHNPATKPHCGQCDEVRLLTTRFGTIPCPNCNPAAERSA
jgi:general stress protein YciG